MSTSQPPRLATLLAQRLVSGPRRESLVGDLVEQYQQGRSAAWYWRQVLVAISLSTAHDVAAHPVLAVRALTVGWGLYLSLAFPVMFVFRSVHELAREWFAPFGVWGIFWADHLPFHVLVSITCVLSGWIVARLHSGHAATMVCLYAGSVLAFELGVPGYMLLSHPIPPGIWSPPNLLVLPAVLSLSHPLSILLGGLWGVRSGDVADVVAVS